MYSSSILRSAMCFAAAQRALYPPSAGGRTRPPAPVAPRGCRMTRQLFQSRLSYAGSSTADGTRSMSPFPARNAIAEDPRADFPSLFPCRLQPSPVMIPRPTVRPLLVLSFLSILTNPRLTQQSVVCAISPPLPPRSLSSPLPPNSSMRKGS